MSPESTQTHATWRFNTCTNVSTTTIFAEQPESECWLVATTIKLSKPDPKAKTKSLRLWKVSCIASNPLTLVKARTTASSSSSTSTLLLPREITSKQS